MLARDHDTVKGRHWGNLLRHTSLRVGRQPSTYTHVRLGLPARSRLVWLATCPSACAQPFAECRGDEMSRPPPGPQSRGRSSYMLGGAFATFTISAGLMHSYAVFLVAFLEDFRWSRSDVS